jgi:hypothetical protein
MGRLLASYFRRERQGHGQRRSRAGHVSLQEFLSFTVSDQLILVHGRTAA